MKKILVPVILVALILPGSLRAQIPAHWDSLQARLDLGRPGAALAIATALREKAQAENDQPGWTRALVEEVKLHHAQGAQQTAAEHLLVQPWPADPDGRDLLGLFKAQALLEYYQRYSWQLHGNEGAILPSPGDLSTWSAGQVGAEIMGTLATVWSRRQVWDDAGLEGWSGFVQQNDYPARVRGTRRDAVTYLWADFLTDSRLWTGIQEEGVNLLDREELMDGDRSLDGLDELLADPAVHPLRKLSLILADLRRWHQEHGRLEAAHEAQLELLRHLRFHFGDRKDRVRLRQKLETLQADFDPALPWWSFGQWRLAKFLRAEDEIDSRVKAHLAAVRGARRHPDTVGGKLCARQVAEIEAVDLRLEAMGQDGPGKRSIRISHTNLERVHLRAWRHDWEEPEPLRRRLLDRPDSEEITSWVESGASDLAWTVELPPVDDYGTHQTFTALPACPPGPYLVVASLREDFKDVRNQFAGLHLLVSDLVLQGNRRDQGWEVRALSGETGQPLPGVELEVLAQDRRRPPADEPTATLRTDDRGTALVVSAGNLAVLGRRGDDLALLDNLWHHAPSPPRTRQRCLLYTDRSVFRPGQTVHWKAILFQEDPRTLDHRIVPEGKLTVLLFDPNRQEAARFEGVTNRFGSASGQFTLPEGGLLGSWQVEVPGVDRAVIQVEEYKRPTFEATLDDPAGQPRLDAPVRLQGRATHYFGQPVTAGRVTWTVTRAPVFRWWNPWREPPTGTAILAAGADSLAVDGVFTIDFTPTADERLPRTDQVSYSFLVEAKITSAGGETRTARRTYRLGFVGVEATLDAEEEFLLTGESGRFTARRANLDGKPLAGEGQWRLLALRQPEVTPLPCDLPREGEPRLATAAGDTLRARWEPGRYGPDQLRSWADGQELARGRVDHGPDGLAEIGLPDLAAGAYRLRYATADDQGRPVTAHREFLVAGADRTPLAMPLVVLAQSRTVEVGGTARLLVHSGLPCQVLRLKRSHHGVTLRDELLTAGAMDELLEIPVTEELRGGFTVQVCALRDFQPLEQTVFIDVPWDNKDLQVEFLSFRDRIVPGADETITVRVTGPDDRAVAAGTTEVLAYMHDRTLDLFAPHRPPRPADLFPQWREPREGRWTLGTADRARVRSRHFASTLPPEPVLHPDRVLLGYPREFLDDDQRTAALLNSLDMPVVDTFVVEGAQYMVEVKSAISVHTVSSEHFDKFAIDSVEEALSSPAGLSLRSGELPVPGGRSGQGPAVLDGAPEPAVTLRENFSPTAFFAPHVQLEDDGTAVIEFKVPDSVTDWTVWAHAVGPDLSSGSAHRNTSSLKDLLVRPYLPRFLREGDRAVLKVLVDNTGGDALSGRVQLQLTDPETGRDLAGDFGIDRSGDLQRAFEVAAGQSADLSFELQAPRGCGQVAVQVVARAANLSDGERHLLPILPGRTHLVQSRFVTLDGQSRREMSFPLLGAGQDPSLVTDQLVVTVDAQLFQGVLAALPYLRDYPYECTEQTLNRFLSTAMVAGIFADHPAVKQMAARLSERTTRLPAWEKDDPNRRLRLEETPWLARSRGGDDPPEDLINMLDPGTVGRQRAAALERLQKIQDPGGGFAWWPGGEPSPYLTLYVLQGLARAHEFGAEWPADLALPAWRYLHQTCLGRRVDQALARDLDWTQLTFLNYLLSGLDDAALAETGFTPDDRRLMLEFSFRHWREHSRLLKTQLALTLQRDGRPDDARLVMESVLNGLRTDPDLGAWWAPEDRAWLWQNDTVEAHAFVLRALSELDPGDERRHGLVKWLLLNRQLGHWKSTRATAEVIYGLVHYLEQEGALGVPERIAVMMGRRSWELDFDPATFTGADNHIVVPGAEVDAEGLSTIIVEKSTPGPAFASATWHFSTEQPPATADGDLLQVTRRYFRRFEQEGAWVLEPLGEGDPLRVGDQVVVRLDITARHAAEYVHLRDPRGAGFEPERVTSGHGWDGGLGFYREVRDSGENFFFDRLPAGSYTLQYRLRAAMAGTFKAAPAQLQSMYAPEFTAHSAGAELAVRP